MRYWKRISAKIKQAPKTPGVYIFYKKRNPLYIGKAANLKNRLQSYVKLIDSKSERLHENATDLEIVDLRSEIEALIEEAKFIKKLNPPYNILWRDDKSYFYTLITNEQFPKIFVVHKNKASRVTGQESRVNIIGPFTEGRALKLVLRMLRRNFPYCTCPRSHFRLCLNAQIGNCFGFCCMIQDNQNKPSIEQVKNYRKNIATIKNFLLGKPLKKITKNLKPEEREALEKILAHREFLENFDSDKVISHQSSVKSYLIEGYDISHLSGREVVAGMTAWRFSAEGGSASGGDSINLSPRKEFWRKFIIRTAEPADDPAAIAEAVSRRLRHPEWPYPDVMIIDGGITQFNAAREIVEKFGVAKKIHVVSFAKPGQLLYGLQKNLQQLDEAPAEFKKIIPRVIQETHNFAIRFHRARRRKNFLNFELDLPRRKSERKILSL